MAKKISKEMMEALKTAKSPEDLSKVLNAEGFDMQKLSLDDLDQVSGGAMTKDEIEYFCYVLSIIGDNYGKAGVADFHNSPGYGHLVQSYNELGIGFLRTALINGTK